MGDDIEKDASVPIDVKVEAVVVRLLNFLEIYGAKPGP